jgi:DNA primase
MLDYLITEEGEIVKGHYLGTHAKDFTRVNRENLKLIKESPEIREEIYKIIESKIDDLKKQIEKEKEEVIDWYEENWTSANEWKKEKQKEKSFIIKPGFTEFELSQYETLEKSLRKLSNKAKSSGRWVDPSLVEKANETPIDTLMDFDRADKALCLWHNEDTPSLSLHREGNFVKCFGQCGTVHSAIDVYCKINNCDFVTAVKQLTHE